MSYDVDNTVSRLSVSRVITLAMAAGITVLGSLGLDARAQGAAPAGVVSRANEDLVVEVPAMAATCMAALERNDERILVVGEGHAVACAKRLWVVYPDANGTIPAQVPVTVPWPAEVNTAYPVALVFHPHLPLLYVWRHNAAVEATPETPDDFAHLLVYAFGKKGAAPELLASLCRGQQYAARLLPSFMNTDPEGKRLFLPNLRIQPDKGALRAAVGYLQLGDDGLPVIVKDQPLSTLIDVADFKTSPNGWGFCPVNPRLLLMATEGGLLVWDVVDRRAGLSRVLFPRELMNSQGFLSGDNRRIYWAGAGINKLVTMRHADGYPTLIPTLCQIEGAVFSTPPVMLAGTPKKLAIGGRGEVILVGLTNDGSFSGVDARLLLPSQGIVSVMAYMPRMNRLYLPVEGKHEP